MLLTGLGPVVSGRHFFMLCNFFPIEDMTNLCTTYAMPDPLICCNVVATKMWIK